MEGTPRLSRSKQCKPVDMRKPFTEVLFVNDFSRSIPLMNIIAQARKLGARTLLIEDIESDQEIEKENEILRSVFKNHKMPNLKRLSFWTSHFTEPDAIAKQTSRNLAGYAILKYDQLQNDDHADRWHVFEAAIRYPKRENIFIARQNKYSLKVLDSDFEISGILFCGQNGLHKTCGLVNLRSISSYITGSDVSYSELYSLIGDEYEAMAQGIRPSDINAILTHFKINSDHYNYDLEQFASLSSVFPYSEVIYNAISASGAALLAFQTVDKQLYHAISVYGYGLNNASCEYVMDSSYFTSSEAEAPPYASIKSWISEFVCSDDNFGPYLSLPSHFLSPSQVNLVISAYPANTKTSGFEVSVAAQSILHSAMTVIPMHGVKDSTWFKVLERCITTKTLILRTTTMTRKEYCDYLSSARDWHNNTEDLNLVEVLIKSMKDSTLWVVEFTSPELLSSYHKLGEIIMVAEEKFQFEDFVNQNFLFLRMPKLYLMREKEDFTCFQSKLVSHTPFINRGDILMARSHSEFEYDVALSFAGENRDVVEEMATMLEGKNVRVFYDDFEKANLWGKDLYQHLQKVYRDMARYCIIFISQWYAEKAWPKHELKQAQARDFADNDEYILPIRLDDSEVPGINVTTGYMDLRNSSVEEIADLVLQKLNL